jgi:hypothetical protein
LLDWLSTYENPEKFNEEFIYLKQKDDLLAYIGDICQALEVVDGIKFLGASINTDESTFKHRGGKEGKWISVEESRLNLIKIKFQINFKDKEEIIEKEIYFPKLINNFYFILNGSKYYPIYQIIDACTYKTPRSLTLKTLLMPIVIRNIKTDFTDINGVEFSSKVFTLDLFKSKTNFILYFLAKMGFDSVIDYFGFSNDIGVLLQDDADISHPDFYFFGLTKKIYLFVRKTVMETEFGSNFVGSLINACSGRMTIEELYNLGYWEKRLGSLFTKNTNAHLEKARKILISFERILDNGTKKNLRISSEDKESVYSIVRWMIRNYTELYNQDNMDLANKRLRVTEYLIHPLLLKFSANTYRLLNSKSLSISKIKSIFNISPGFVLKKIIVSDLLRYNNSVNTIDLFNSALRFSQRGPQSMADGGRTISVRFRGLHQSYLGRVGLTASSASDPGMTGTLTPFLETDGFFFKNEGEGNYYEE